MDLEARTSDSSVGGAASTRGACSARFARDSLRPTVIPMKLLTLWCAHAEASGRHCFGSRAEKRPAQLEARNAASPPPVVGARKWPPVRSYVTPRKASIPRSASLSGSASGDAKKVQVFPCTQDLQCTARAPQGPNTEVYGRRLHVERLTHRHELNHRHDGTQELAREAPFEKLTGRGRGRHEGRCEHVLCCHVA